MASNVSWEGFKQAFEETRKEEGKEQFIKHAVLYVAMNALLVVMNFIYSPSVLWFFYPMLGWGVALAVHYLNAIHWVDRRSEETEARAEYRAKIFAKRLKKSLKK